MLFHPGQHRTHGRDAKVVDAGRSGPDEHDPITNRPLWHLSGEEIRGGDRQKGARRPQPIDQHSVPRIHRNLAPTDGERAAEIQLKSRRLDAQREPRRLHAERGIVGAAILEDQSFPAGRAVLVGDHRDVPEGLRRIFELPNRRSGALSLGRRVATALAVLPEANHCGLEGHPGGFGRGARNPRLEVEHDREHRPSTFPKGARQLRVGVGGLRKTVELPAERLALRARGRNPERAEPLRHSRHHAKLVTHFRLAEDEIERDRLRPVVGEGPHHASEHRTGPRPATEGGEALFIDRHDRHLISRILRTAQDEMQVVELVLDGLQEGRRPQIEREHEDHDARRDQIDSTVYSPPARAPRGPNGPPESPPDLQSHPTLVEASRSSAAGRSRSPRMTASGLTGAVARPSGVT